jgi:hypothetical protein
MHTLLQWAQRLLQGKKTYVVGLAMIIVGLHRGDHTLLLEGLGFVTMAAKVNRMMEDF